MFYIIVMFISSLNKLTWDMLYKYSKFSRTKTLMVSKPAAKLNLDGKSDSRLN